MSVAIHSELFPEAGGPRPQDLLRLVTAGSVDDGKSTLIGRLLYDSQGIYEDQLSAVRRASAGNLQLALLTDGLRAEREQGITIDVAYRYFNTARRKFILADTPGHEQYTRNMATGASNAELAILLLDAAHGIQPQSKRHAFIIALLGIKHIAVVINKMDLVGYDQKVFEDLRQQLLATIAPLGFDSAVFLPVCAENGANVVRRGERMPWYRGPALLEYLETIEVRQNQSEQPFRLPVQRALRTSDFRGYSGQIAAGNIRVGDEVAVLPGFSRSRVKSIVTYDGELECAGAPQSITLALEDELDISRGDLIASAAHPPLSLTRFRAQMIWFGDEPLWSGRQYLLKHTTQIVRAQIETQSRVNIRSLESEPAATLRMNDIGTVQIEATSALFADAYRHTRPTGSLVVIDPANNNTVAAAMIVAPAKADERPTAVRKGQVFNLRGRETLARTLEKRLRAENREAVVLASWSSRAANLLTEAGIHVLALAGLGLPDPIGQSDEAAAELVLTTLRDQFQ